MKKTVNWYKQQVLKGDQSGGKIGFPTINLSPKFFVKLKEGVYSSEVIYRNKKYLGALFFGPRLVKGETKPVLEIHILNFSNEIYGETIEFKIGKFIRGVMNFKDMNSLKKQMEDDIKNILKTNT